MGLTRALGLALIRLGTVLTAPRRPPLPPPAPEAPKPPWPDPRPRCGVCRAPMENDWHFLICGLPGEPGTARPRRPDWRELN